MKINLDNIDALIFDFDGVLTNNLVYINENGNETVCCSRADGLAFDVLRILKKPAYILSTEKNLVVEQRAKKLKITALYGVKNKSESLNGLAKLKGYRLKNILYVGNDLNDYLVMKLCGYRACPADSHSKIKNISNIPLKKNGGEGVVRELLEDVMQLDFIKILYQPKQ